MDAIEFVRLEAEPKDNGQRIEVDVVAAAADVSAAISEFYRLMARVRGIDAADEAAVRERLDALVGAEVTAEALRDFVLNRLTTAAVRQVGVDTVLAPGVHAEDDPVAGEDYAFTVNLIPRPEVSLSSIEPVTVSPSPVMVEEADIDEQLAYTAQQFAALVPADHQDLREGDFALMDVDMLRDGKPARDLSGVRRPVEVARGLLPDALVDAVVGMEPGDVRKAAFTLEGLDGPEEYKADVRLWEVRERREPVIDDAWVAENLPQFGDVAGFRAYVRTDLEGQAARVEQQDLVCQARAALERRLEGTIPDEMYQDAKDSLVASIQRKLEAEGTDLDAYLAEHDMTPDVFNMNTFMQASELLRQNLALDALARARGLEPTPDEVARAKAALPAAAALLTDEELAERGMLAPLMDHLRREKAQAWLLETAVVEEAAPSDLSRA